MWLAAGRRFIGLFVLASIFTVLVSLLLGLALGAGRFITWLF